MKIIYEAFDGEHFNDASKCLEHEQDLAKIKMFYADGPTKDPSNALLVYLPNKYAEKAFVTLCEKIGASCEGINGEYGYYIWCEYFEQYYPISNIAVEAVLNMKKGERD